jgi:hypothetical protein
VKPQKKKMKKTSKVTTTVNATTSSANIHHGQEGIRGISFT